MRVYPSLICTLLVGALATTVAAQDSATKPSDGTTTTGTTTGTTTTDTTAQTTTSSKTTLPTLGTSSTLTGVDVTTVTTKTSTTEARTSSIVVITGGSTAATSNGVPRLSTSSDKLPALTGTSTGIDIPVVTVPPTSNAPFMRKSSLPEGTVFIAVGSALAFFALAVIAWRGLVAWSIHRSVRKAATHVHISDSKSKAILRPPPSGPGGFYAGTGPGSQLGLDHLATSPRTTTRPDGRQITPNNSLFFSPTAGNPSGVGDRRSAYLPAGYYASGQRDSVVMSQGLANNSHTHLHTQSISSTRYGGRNVGVSPPGSPSIGPQGVAVGAGAGTASLSLPPTARAPSAYLEDLFESHRAPQGNGSGRGY